MRIVSWNVNGIRAIIKKEFFESVNVLDPDIICIQETKAQDLEVEKALSPLKDHQLYINSAERKGYSGTAILSKSKPVTISYGMGITEHDAEGRVICAEFANFYLINVYVPNSGQKLERLPYRSKWDADFLRFLKEKEKIKPLIVCGDFNVAHRAIDLKNDKSNYNKTAGYTQIEIDGMDNFINSGFIDSFRTLNPDQVAYTYWNYRFKARERNTGWRIDYFLISKALLPKVESSQILPQYFGSDHCPILMEMDL